MIRLKKYEKYTVHDWDRFYINNLFNPYQLLEGLVHLSDLAFEQYGLGRELSIVREKMAKRLFYMTNILSVVELENLIKALQSASCREHDRILEEDRSAKITGHHNYKRLVDMSKSDLVSALKYHRSQLPTVDPFSSVIVEWIKEEIQARSSEALNINWKRQEVGKIQVTIEGIAEEETEKKIREFIKTLRKGEELNLINTGTNVRSEDF